MLALGCRQGWQTVPNAGFIAALNRGGPLPLDFGVLGRSGALARLGDACVPGKIGAVPKIQRDNCLIPLLFSFWALCSLLV